MSDFINNGEIEMCVQIVLPGWDKRMPWVPEHISLTPPTARSYRRNPDKVVARIKGYKNVKAYYAALWEALPKREQRELSAVAPTIAEVSSSEGFTPKNALVLRNPAIANFFDLCAISLPLPRVGGLPVGLMLELPPHSRAESGIRSPLFLRDSIQIGHSANLRNRR